MIAAAVVAGISAPLAAQTSAEEEQLEDARSELQEARQSLMDGDVILQIGGRTPNDTRRALRIPTSFESGETLELEIMRNQRRETLEVEFPWARAATLCLEYALRCILTNGELAHGKVIA